MNCSTCGKSVEDVYFVTNCKHIKCSTCLKEMEQRIDKTTENEVCECSQVITYVFIFPVPPFPLLPSKKMDLKAVRGRRYKNESRSKAKSEVKTKLEKFGKQVRSEKKQAIFASKRKELMEVIEEKREEGIQQNAEQNQNDLRKQIEELKLKDAQNKRLKEEAQLQAERYKQLYNQQVQRAKKYAKQVEENQNMFSKYQAILKQNEELKKEKQLMAIKEKSETKLVVTEDQNKRN